MRRLVPFLTPLMALPLVFAEAPKEADYRRSSLIDRPPFVRGDKAPGKVAAGSLELRGFYSSGSVVEVSLMHPETKESAWVRVGDTEAKWVVESANVAAGTVDVRHNGALMRLTMAVPESASFPPPPPPAGNDKQFGYRLPSRSTLQKAIGLKLNALRVEHPEYFDGSPLTEDQQKDRKQTLATITIDSIIGEQPEGAEKKALLEKKESIISSMGKYVRTPKGEPVSEGSVVRKAVLELHKFREEELERRENSQPGSNSGK